MMKAHSVRKEDPVVILGAGAAGLSAGVILARAGYKVVVIEKQSYLGGLASTFKHGPFRIDFGPHAFHCKNDETDILFREFCSLGFRDIYMKASLLLHGKYFEYPLKFGQAMLRLEPAFTTKMLFDYLSAQIRNLFFDVPENSFEAWGLKRYGRTIYDMAFGNYSRKVWGMSTKQLHWKLAQQKLPDLNFLELVKEALGGKGSKQKILYSSYSYPKHGIGVVFDSMGEAIRQAGGKILLESEPEEIFCQDDCVIGIGIKGRNGSEQIPCSVLINSIPLNDFMSCFKENTKSLSLEASKNLVYRHLMLAYLDVAKVNVTNEIMVYLLDPKFNFNRIGEQKNIAPEMAPVDRTVVSFEICTDEGGKWWHISENQFIEAAKENLLKLGTVRSEEIKGGFVKRIKNAYPIYNLSFDRNLSLVQEWLEHWKNIYTIGRQGLFLNSDIHDSMKMGIEGAHFILSGQGKSKWNERIRHFLNWRLE